MTKLPDGWHHGQHTALDGVPDNRPVQCHDCGWEGREDDVERTLWEIHKLAERLDSGDVVPVGTCPAIHTDSKDGDYACGALVYYSDVIVAYRRAPNVLERLAEEV